MGSVPMKREKKKVDMRMRKRKKNKKREAGLATRALVSLADLAGRSTSAHANLQPKGNIKLKKNGAPISAVGGTPTCRGKLRIS